MALELVGRRERKKQAQRQNICDETLLLIGRHGVEGTTIDAICDCADIAKKTFYNYYSSKHDLMLDICQNTLLNRADTLINEALYESEDLAQQLEYVCQVMMERNRNAGKLERELIDYMVGSLSSNLDIGAGQLVFMNRCFTRLFESGREQLKPELSPDFCAEMIVGMLNALTLNWLHEENYDTQKKYRMLVDYVKHSMLKS